jgi:hypothetical protein
VVELVVAEMVFLLLRFSAFVLEVTAQDLLVRHYMCRRPPLVGRKSGQLIRGLLSAG